MPSVRQRIAAGVTQHVRMRLERQLGRVASSFNHAREACRGERRAALGREHKT
jgi:hypothetical protein